MRTVLLILGAWLMVSCADDQTPDASFDLSVADSDVQDSSITDQSLDAKRDAFDLDALDSAADALISDMRVDTRADATDDADGSGMLPRGCSNPAPNQNWAYDYSRVIGYIWGDSASDTGLAFRNSGVLARHLEFLGQRVGRADPVTTSFEERNNRFFVTMEDWDLTKVKETGAGCVYDPFAFVASVIETEASAGQGRLMDDPVAERCEFLAQVVSRLGSVGGFEVTACAGRASQKSPPDPANFPFCELAPRPEVGGHCGVWLSGRQADWETIFADARWHFVNCNRVPGDNAPERCSTQSPMSRP